MVYNGQGRNKAELNGDKHIGVRLAYPFELPNGRLLETGIMAFRESIRSAEPAHPPAPPRRQGVSKVLTGKVAATPRMNASRPMCGRRRSPGASSLRVQLERTPNGMKLPTSLKQGR